MKRLRLLFDTNILEPLSKPPLGNSLDRIRKHLAQRYIYVISPLTVDELLLGIQNGDERYFARDQAKMSVLRGLGKARLLPPPASCALKQSLGLEVSAPAPSSAIVEKSIDCVLRAGSKQQLVVGFVPARLGQRTGGLDFEHIRQRHEWGKKEHARILEALRAKQLRRPSPEEWARKSFRYFE